MNRVLKVTLTRRLFYLFFSLALIPTLILTLVFSLLRIRADQQRVLELEQDLAAKPSETFKMLARSKADHFSQVLEYRSNFVTYLADIAAQSPQLSLSTVYDLLLPLIESSPQTDGMISSVAIYFPTQSQTAYPEEIDLVSFAPDLAWADVNSPAPNWMLRQAGGQEVLTYIAPILIGSQVHGAVVVDYWLDQILQEVPRYFLAETAVMFLVSDDLSYVGFPSWSAGAQYLDDYFNVEVGTEPVDLNQPEFSTQAEELSGYFARLADDDLILEFTDLTELPCYISVSNIDATPLYVVLLFPMEEVVNTAVRYGASFQGEAKSILTQSLSTALVLMVSIGIGAMATLRLLAEPIQELSKGAKEVAEGNLDYTVPVGGIGEISDLGNSFNSMVAAVQSSQSALEGKRAELEETLTTQKKEFDLINQVSYQANLAVDLPKKLNTTLDIIIKELGMSAGFIYLLNEVGGLFRTSAVIDPSIKHDQVEKIFSPSDKLLAEQVLEKRSVVIEEKLVGADGGAEPCYCSIGAPIQFRDRLLGVMILYNRDVNLGKQALENFIAALSTHIAILIEVWRLRSQTRFLEVAEERRRLARDLHDSVTQTLFSLSMTLDGLLSENQAIPAKVKEQLSFISEQALAARGQMRAMIEDLRPLDLGRQTLDDSIRAHANGLMRTTDIKVEIKFAGDLKNVPTPIQYNLDRIVQETLSNIARHARADVVRMSLQVDRETVELTISDNGIGFSENSNENGSSFGLMSIRERAEIMGGEVTITSQPGKGTQVQVKVPLQVKLLES